MTYKKEILIIILILFTFVIRPVWADSKPRDHSRWSTKKCAINTVLVSMGGLKFNVPRYASVRTTDDRVYTNLQNHCETLEISDAKNIIWSTPESFEFNKTGRGTTTYQNYKEKVITNEAVAMPNGTKRIILPGQQIFILPLEKAPTKNGDPVAIVCPWEVTSTATCFTSYEHPLGFKFSYFVFLKSHTISDLLGIDTHKREAIEEMLIQ